MPRNWLSALCVCGIAAGMALHEQPANLVRLSAAAAHSLESGAVFERWIKTGQWTDGGGEGALAAEAEVAAAAFENSLRMFRLE